MILNLLVKATVLLCGIMYTPCRINNVFVQSILAMYMVLIVSPVVSCALPLAQSAQMSRMLNQLGVESHYINSDLSQVCVHLSHIVMFSSFSPCCLRAVQSLAVQE